MREIAWDVLRGSLEGDLHLDEMTRMMYATDASVYRELPLGVATPRHTSDLVQLVHFARQSGISLIPRSGGTSLAGQCVGDGLVVDVSQYMTEILEIDSQKSRARVQPGVIRNDLNHHLKDHGLFFGPNTSTANRAMIGGMVGNNSCGSYSIVYGTTRDHVHAVTMVLADGQLARFGPVSPEEFSRKCEQKDLEGQIYRQLRDELSNPDTQERIRKNFPHPDLHRRNTGYAVDVLLRSALFTPGGPEFNLAKLICGSEGTLGLLAEIEIDCVPVPPPVTGLLCVHFKSVQEALQAVLLAMEHAPRAVELMDKTILDCTRDSRSHSKNRFFIEGDPDAILVIEVGGEDRQEVDQKLVKIDETLRTQGFGYAYPRIFGPEIRRVWALREAGLGLLANIPGDAKPVAVIEDTAVRLPDLPEYINEFTRMMARYGQRAVYYAHAGAGELHLRPILNLKDAKDRRDFRDIARDTAVLVKKYGGSLSGEHGDGRVRAEFIPLMIGEENYDLLRRLKRTWDPNGIFNPGKIVDAPPMDESLRYQAGQQTPDFDTVLDFSDYGGILRAAEKCNGSADCRKTHLSGGIMCPSYMATRDEKDTTRARANVLREILTQDHSGHPFAREELKEVMDLCLSCKGCATECPSDVDMARLKAEVMHQYYRHNGIPLRARAFANIAKINRYASRMAGLSNFMLGNPVTGAIAKAMLGVAPQRKLPPVAKAPLRKWYKKYRSELVPSQPFRGKVLFYADEFINYNDAGLGRKAIKLLLKLGYEVEVPAHAESGRAYISKGLLKDARCLAMYNVEALADKVSADTPLVGLEPSGILTFRDEVPRLVIPEYREMAERIKAHALTFEEFIEREMEAGRILPKDFQAGERQLLLHGHCHQKTLSTVESSARILSLPQGHQVEIIPSGCCGMAGSFGYEKDHYDVSMKIGELVLFPAVRNADEDAAIVAPGFSCRHQIADGTGRKALHPVDILWEALK